MPLCQPPSKCSLASASVTVEEKETATDRIIRLREEAEAAKASPVVLVIVTEPATKPKDEVKTTAKAKSSRFLTTAIRLVNPDAASPVWKGKRGEAFGVIETFYGDKTSAELTVGKWLEIVAATPSLTKVGFEFLRFYEAQGLITLVPVAVVPPVAAEVKAGA